MLPVTNSAPGDEYSSVICLTQICHMVTLFSSQGFSHRQTRTHLLRVFVRCVHILYSIIQASEAPKKCRASTAVKKKKVQSSNEDDKNVQKNNSKKVLKKIAIELKKEIVESMSVVFL